MVNNYVRGRNAEYRAKDYLEKKGYYVIRSSGSHTTIDLIALPNNDYFHRSILLLQLKRVKGKYYSFKKEIQELRDLNIINSKEIKKQFWIWLDPIKSLRKGQWVRIELGLTEEDDKIIRGEIDEN